MYLLLSPIRDHRRAFLKLNQLALEARQILSPVDLNTEVVYPEHKFLVLIGGSPGKLYSLREVKRSLARRLRNLPWFLPHQTSEIEIDLVLVRDLKVLHLLVLVLVKTQKCVLVFQSLVSEEVADVLELFHRHTVPCY